MPQSAIDDHSRPDNHGIISGDHFLITGGSYTTINNIFSAQIVSQQQQVLGILCPLAGSSRIDGRLLHNSTEHEGVHLGSVQHLPDQTKVHLRQIFQQVIDHVPKRGAHRRGSSHYVRKGSFKHVSIPVAEHLAHQRLLLATIILPDSTPSCKIFIVTTLAYQLVQNIPSSAEYMLAALRNDPEIFGRNTDTQFKELFQIPLDMACTNASIAEKVKWPNIIVLGGTAQHFAPGSVAHRVLRLLSMLPVNTITHIEVQSHDIPQSRPRSLCRRFWDFVLSLIYYLRS